MSRAAGSPIQVLLDRLMQVAGTPARALISGGNHVSREMVARLMHRNSPRAARNFVSVNCESIAGQFDILCDKLCRANNGTIFLDDVGFLTPALQQTLLDVMKDSVISPLNSSRPVVLDVRMLAGTENDLGKNIVAGKFREDLYYRLNMVSLQIPDDGKADVAMAGAHATSLIPTSILQAKTFAEFKESAEREFLLAKLHEMDWNISETARALSMPRSNLYKKIARYSLLRENHG